jgi:5-methylcytosine-specific restriction protein A
MIGRLKKRCKTPGCPNLHNNPEGYCDDCLRKRLASWSYQKIMHVGRTPDKRENATQRGYTWEWRQWAKEYLLRHPVCAICGKRATVVDHKDIPGKVMLDMWGYFPLDEKYYQPLCQSCNLKKSVEDRRRIKEYFTQKGALDAMVHKAHKGEGEG